ncbi:MAG: hypothetical protein WD691_10100 [Acidimicrobiales bacterium]
MTDHDQRLDDLASAYLDGELSDEERAREVDEAVLERVDRLRVARDALVGERVVVDPARRDRAITAALEAFDAGAVDADSQGRGGEVVAMERVATRHSARRAAQLTAIAAAVAMIALAVPFLGDLDSGSDQTVMSAPTESADQRVLADGAPSAGAAPESLAVAPSDEMADLGSFNEVADLATAVRARLDGAAADVETSSGGSGAGGGNGKELEICAAERSDLDTVVLAALAELDGRPVLVLVRDAEGGGRTLLALDLESCAVVASQEL